MWTANEEALTQFEEIGGPDNNQMAEAMLPLELGGRRYMPSKRRGISSDTVLAHK